MDVIDEVFEAYGGVPALRERFGYATDQGVYIWRQRGIPRSHCADIHLEKGIDLKRLLDTSKLKTESK